MFMGRGAWALLAPLRSFISLCHGFYRGMNPPVSSASPPLSGPWIISIGNIEVGGGGKTPCALAIAEVLRANGMRPAVVTRGYGGSASGKDGVIAIPSEYHADHDLPPEYAVWKGGSEGDAVDLMGDEAVLYMRAGLPLAVDADRERGIIAVTGAVSPTHVILDDAFQRAGLAKDLDILLLDARRPFGSGALLPRGTLREPPSSVSRAGVIVFTRAEGSEVPGEAARLVEGKPVFFARHVPKALRGRDGSDVEADALKGSRVVLFSGIARPGSFEKTALEFGLDPEISFRFDDHHVYSGADVKAMTDECSEGSVYVTTAKDWAKAAPLFPAGIKLLRLDMEMEIPGVERLLEPVMRERIRQGG